MLSRAHTESAVFNIDPAYSAEGQYPIEFPGKGVWFYGHYEREAFILERMCREKNEAKLKVGYTEFRRVPGSRAFFKNSFEKNEIFIFRTTGAFELWVNGRKILTAAEPEKEHSVLIPEDAEVVLCIQCEDITRELPALWCPVKKENWSYSPDGREYSTAVNCAARADGIAPHHAPMAQMELCPRQIAENVWDFNTEVLGIVEIRCAAEEKPEIYVGESRAEMENRDPGVEEQTRELISREPGCFVSKVPLALRYIQIENASAPEVKLKGFFQPAEYKGAFALPEDGEMTKIWMHSAYTLRLCMMNFLLDGIKRDRLPWAGDLAVSLLGNAYSFGNSQLVRDTLSILGAVSVKVAHINTIVDYTLWYIINHDLYQLYFADREFLELEYPRISETLDFLLTLREERGFLRADRPGDWLFIDWVPGEKITALQMLFVMALRAGSRLARRMNDSIRSEILENTAAQLVTVVKEKCFDSEKGLFTVAPDAKEFSRHANLLAVTAGAAEGISTEFIKKALTEKNLPPVGTPYMSVFEAMALSRCNAPWEAVAKVREIWGGMLREGASTFWEGFDPAHSGNEHLAFYNRPFGKSLCHAWSAGPLFLLPQLFLGIEVLEDGWRKFRVAPLPGITASAAVPTPWGKILIDVVDGKLVSLSAPEQCTKVND